MKIIALDFNLFKQINHTYKHMYKIILKYTDIFTFTVIAFTVGSHGELYPCTNSANHTIFIKIVIIFSITQEKLILHKYANYKLVKGTNKRNFTKRKNKQFVRLT